MPDLAILYEHPLWFKPLFAALERRGVDYLPIPLAGHHYDPASRDVPAPLVFNRIAMSSILRDPDHAIFYTQALLQHWRGNGAAVINGPEALAIDSSKAVQLSLIQRLGLHTPRTLVVHRAADLAAAAEALGFPLLVKANIGGAGAGIARYDTADELAAAVAEGSVPASVDKVLLVQDYAPPRDGKIVRIETLGGRYLYAIDVVSGGATFDLCPADVCVTAPGKPVVTMTRADPEAEVIRDAEAIVAAAGIDVGGVELLVDDRDGTVRFYDVNALSNFVANPLDVLGWDPHERLVDYLVGRIAVSTRLEAVRA